MRYTIQSLFFFFTSNFSFPKFKQHKANISSIIFIYGISSYTYEELCSQARSWSYSSTAPRRNSYMNVCFHNSFLPGWYCTIIGTVQVRAHGGPILGWVPWHAPRAREVPSFALSPLSDRASHNLLPSRAWQRMEESRMPTLQRLMVSFKTILMLTRSKEHHIKHMALGKAISNQYQC